MVPTALSHVEHTADGVMTSFAIPFYWERTGHLRVRWRATPEDAWTDAPEGLYSASGERTDAGFITWYGEPPPAGATVRIERQVLIVQETSFRTHGPFSPEAHEAALDYQCFVAQQLWRRLQELEATNADLLARVLVLEGGGTP